MCYNSQGHVLKLLCQSKMMHWMHSAFSSQLQLEVQALEDISAFLKKIR